MRRNSCRSVMLSVGERTRCSCTPPAERTSFVFLMRQRACRSLWRKNTKPSIFCFAASRPAVSSILCKPSLALVRPISSEAININSDLALEVRRTCRVYNVTGGQVPYDQAWLWQQRLLYERMAWQREEPAPKDSHDVLLLLEHPSVYTLGRGSTLDNLRFDPADPACEHEVRRTERGGEVTWHGPGQIVGYPVLDLNYHKKDLHWYLRQLEEVGGVRIWFIALFEAPKMDYDCSIVIEKKTIVLHRRASTLALPVRLHRALLLIFTVILIFILIF